MRVTLIKALDGKDLEYETGFRYFVDAIKLRIAEHESPKITPSVGQQPVKCAHTEREITYYFSHKNGERCIYAPAPCGETAEAACVVGFNDVMGQ